MITFCKSIPNFIKIKAQTDLAQQTIVYENL